MFASFIYSVPSFMTQKKLVNIIYIYILTPIWLVVGYVEQEAHYSRITDSKPEVKRKLFNEKHIL